MENFYNYTIENYTLSGEAKRMLDSLVLYVFDNFTNDGGLYCGKIVTRDEKTA